KLLRQVPESQKDPREGPRAPGSLAGRAAIPGKRAGVAGDERVAGGTARNRKRAWSRRLPAPRRKRRRPEKTQACAPIIAPEAHLLGWLDYPRRPKQPAKRLPHHGGGKKR